MKNRAGRQNVVLASKATSGTGKEATSAGYARLIALQNDNVDALVRFHKTVYDSAVEWSNGLLDFAGRHFQKQWNGAGWQLNGVAPLEAVASHLRYCQSSAEQCLEQTAKFLTLASKLSRDSRMHLENRAVPLERTVPTGRRVRR